tara:strand:- start:25171 stop:25563 length:393 start_codon:yes stop_codon:yes gene_type:complete
LIELLRNKKNSIALVGASNDPSKYGYKILVDLKSKSHEVLPVNTKEKEIYGSKVYKNVKDITDCPSIINFVVPPNVGFEITKDLVANGYDNFWYQPGAESEEISEYLDSKNKNYIDDKCIMVVAGLINNY